jgi:hypothetical protein
VLSWLGLQLVRLRLQQAELLAEEDVANQELEEEQSALALEEEQAEADEAEEAQQWHQEDQQQPKDNQQQEQPAQSSLGSSAGVTTQDHTRTCQDTGIDNVSSQSSSHEAHLKPAADLPVALLAGSTHKGQPALPPRPGSSGSNMSRSGSNPGVAGLAARAAPSSQAQPNPMTTSNNSAASSAFLLPATVVSNTGSSNGLPLSGSSGALSGLTRRESQQLQAAVNSSYSRMDAARQASVSSLPTLGGTGLGGVPGARGVMVAAPGVTRIDSDLSQVYPSLY